VARKISKDIDTTQRDAAKLLYLLDAVKGRLNTDREVFGSLSKAANLLYKMVADVEQLKEESDPGNQ
jgi:hypothetical protein